MLTELENGDYTLKIIAKNPGFIERLKEFSVHSYQFQINLILGE